MGGKGAKVKVGRKKVRVAQPVAGHSSVGAAARGASLLNQREGQRLLQGLRGGSKRFRRDVENVHQLRVSFRRERAYLRSYGAMMAETGKPGKLGKLEDHLTLVLKKMGRVRDLDVMHKNLGLAARKAEGMGKKEAKALEAIRAGLTKRRKAELAKALDHIDASRAGRRLRKMEALLQDPALDAGSAACLDVESAAPLVTFPLYAKVLLHPAWHSDVEGLPPRGHPGAGDVDLGALEMPEAMHDLRKAMRELRYTMEMFGPWFKVPDELSSQVVDWCDILGEMHDLEVLSKFIAPQRKKLPALTRSLQQRYLREARSWQAIRSRMVATGIEADYRLLASSLKQHKEPAPAAIVQKKAAAELPGSRGLGGEAGREAGRTPQGLAAVLAPAALWFAMGSAALASCVLLSPVGAEVSSAIASVAAR